jgi:tripartite-type tricarboxylate transporter receptor subunit TctC
MRELLRTAALAAALLLPGAGRAAAYPEKPVRIVVAFAPGGNIDITARTIAPGLSEALGQPVVIENRGGAGGRIGATYVAKAPPDGYTVLLGASGTLAVQPAFNDDLEYQPLRDFVFTSLISLVPNVLVVHPSLPVRSVKDIIALAHARPGALMMASAGQGSNGHLTGELFQSMAKVKFLHIPYKGGGAAQADLIGGQVHLIFDPITTPVPHIKAGKLRLIAVTSRTRSPLFPETPTIDESGVRGFDSSTYTGLAIPAAAPKDAVQKLRDAVRVVIEQPRTRQNFEKLGAEVIKSTPEDFARRLQDDQAKWARIRKETGIRVD